jgi:DNA-binding NarL/FixJ family response regulator
MPVADGRELLQGIREVAKARVGVVVMSGTPQLEQWCTRVGITQFLRKPFERSSLVDAVERAREEARMTSVRPRASEPPPSRRIRIDRAVLVVGEPEDVRAVRERLRDGSPPMQVAAVQSLEGATAALASIAVDAVVICGPSAMSSPDLASLIAESRARTIPVIVVGTPPDEVARTPGLVICRGSETADVVEAIRAAVVRPT